MCKWFTNWQRWNLQCGWGLPDSETLQLVGLPLVVAYKLGEISDMGVLSGGRPGALRWMCRDVSRCTVKRLWRDAKKKLLGDEDFRRNFWKKTQTYKGFWRKTENFWMPFTRKLKNSYPSEKPEKRLMGKGNLERRLSAFTGYRGRNL